MPTIVDLNTALTNLSTAVGLLASREDTLQEGPNLQVAVDAVNSATAWINDYLTSSAQEEDL